MSTHLYLALTPKIERTLRSYEKVYRQGILNGEEVMLDRLLKSGITPLDYSAINSNDEGTDFTFFIGNTFYCIQLKWWFKKCIHSKKIKEIYGDMFFDSKVILKRKREIEIKFILLAPFITNQMSISSKDLNKENYYLLGGEKFVYFLNNPKSMLKELE